MEILILALVAVAASEVVHHLVAAEVVIAVVQADRAVPADQAVLAPEVVHHDAEGSRN